MTDEVPHLRLRIREDLTAGDCRVEVLDKDDNVLGDLASSVMYGGVKWEMSGGPNKDEHRGHRGLGLVTITFACERARVDTIEAGGNAPKRCGAPAVGGPCVLPEGHNMGRADVPENHQAL